jgi:hypothetical protein
MLDYIDKIAQRTIADSNTFDIYETFDTLKLSTNIIKGSFSKTISTSNKQPATTNTHTIKTAYCILSVFSYHSHSVN